VTGKTADWNDGGPGTVVEVVVVVDVVEVVADVGGVVVGATVVVVPASVVGAADPDGRLDPQAASPTISRTPADTIQPARR
jgi:hypothetical protein